MHSATPRNDRQAPPVAGVHPLMVDALAILARPRTSSEVEAIAQLRGLRIRLMAKKASTAALVDLWEQKRDQRQAELDEINRQVDDVDAILFDRYGAAPEGRP